MFVVTIYSFFGRFQVLEVSFYNASCFHCFLILNYVPIAHIELYSVFISQQSNISINRFIDDAYNEGIPVVVLTDYTKSGDNIARYFYLVLKLYNSIGLTRPILWWRGWMCLGLFCINLEHVIYVHPSILCPLSHKIKIIFVLTRKFNITDIL